MRGLDGCYVGHRLESKAGRLEGTGPDSGGEHGDGEAGHPVLEGGLAWGVESTAVGSLSLMLFLKNAPLAWAALSAEVQGPQTGGQMQSGALTKTASHLPPTVLSRLGGRTCPSPRQE